MFAPPFDPVLAMAIRFAANLGFLFKEKPYLDRFKAASSAGFKAVEIGAAVPGSWTIQQLVEAKEAANVEVVMMCTSWGTLPDDKGLMAQPGREEDFRTIVSTAIEYAVALKCPKIHMHSGRVDASDATAMARAEETYVANLKHAADKCAEHGITVLIEPISVIPQYFLRHQQQAVDILKKVNRPNAKLEFDTFHAQSLDGNLTMFLQNNWDYVGHIQVGQVPGRHEPNEKGEINFPFLFQSLVSLGYNGWIGCEYNPAGSTTEEGLEWIKPYT